MVASERALTPIARYTMDSDRTGISMERFPFTLRLPLVYGVRYLNLRGFYTLANPTQFEGFLIVIGMTENKQFATSDPYIFYTIL